MFGNQICLVECRSSYFCLLVFLFLLKKKNGKLVNWQTFTRFSEPVGGTVLVVLVCIFPAKLS